MSFSKFDLLIQGKLSQQEIDELLIEAEEDPILKDAIDGFILGQLLKNAEINPLHGESARQVNMKPMGAGGNFRRITFAGLGIAASLCLLFVFIKPYLFQENTGSGQTGSLPETGITIPANGENTTTNDPSNGQTAVGNTGKTNTQKSVAKLPIAITEPYARLYAGEAAGSILAPDMQGRIILVAESPANIDAMKRHVDTLFINTKFTYKKEFKCEYYPDKDYNKAICSCIVSAKEDKLTVTHEVVFLFKLDSFAYNIESFGCMVTPPVK